MQAVSVEKCLDVIPNKFRLAIITMNRARNILLGAQTNVETTKYTKRSVNKALSEIENNVLDLASIEKDIGKNLLVNNLFSKSFKLTTDEALEEESSDEEESIETNNNVIDLDLKDDDTSLDSEDIIDTDDDIMIEDDSDIESE